MSKIRKEPIKVGVCKYCQNPIYWWDKEEPEKIDAHEICEEKEREENKDLCPECKKVVWLWQSKIWIRDNCVYHKKCFEKKRELEGER